MLSSPTLQSPIRIGIYRASSFGDVVLATACIDFLTQLPVPVEITWLGRGAALDLINKSWSQVRCVTVSKGENFSEIQKLVNNLNYLHAFIDLQCNLKSQAIALALKTANRIPTFAAHKTQVARTKLLIDAWMRGRRRPALSKDLTVIPRQFQTMLEPVKQAALTLLSDEYTTGVQYLQPKPRLPIPADFDSPWVKELQLGQWLAIAPGAAHATKQAPLELVTAIVDAVRNTPNYSRKPLGLLIVGDQNDRTVGASVLDNLSWQGPVLNLAGRLSLWETAVALSNVSVVLSNDSSLAHIAEAVDTPSAVLFGPTVEEFGFAPRMLTSKAFSEPIGCRPCSKHGKADCRYGDKLCFLAISPKKVAEFLVERLTTPPNRTRHLDLRHEVS